MFLSFAASYFVLVATFAALAGQHVVRRVIAILGRTSIIIFILALTIFVSAISLGKMAIHDHYLSRTKIEMNLDQRSRSFQVLTHLAFLQTNAGGVGIADMIEKLENHDYMGFDNLCYHSQYTLDFSDRMRMRMNTCLYLIVFNFMCKASQVFVICFMIIWCWL